MDAVMRWDDRLSWLRGHAATDLREIGGMGSWLVAFAGVAPRYVACLRPVGRDGLFDALVEVAALAMPLDCDRLALSFPGRAWSLDDPLPPVVPGVGDLRQRVLAVAEADGVGGAARSRAWALPYDVDGGALRWGATVGPEDDGGDLALALAGLVDGRHEVTADAGTVRRQAERCVRLGHLVGLAPATAALLAGRPR